MALFQSVLAIHFVRHPDTHCKRFLLSRIEGEETSDISIGIWNEKINSKTMLDKVVTGLSRFIKLCIYRASVYNPKVSDYGWYLSCAGLV